MTKRARMNIYDEHLRESEELKKRVAKSRRVIKGKKIAWEQSRHGLIRWYLADQIKDTALDTMRIFVNKIRVHGGRHVHTGGANIFVLKGKGYSMVDGVRYDWSKGDLIMLPIKRGGVDHQHFNLDEKPSIWVALISRHFVDALGRFIEQRETHPDWKENKTK